MTAKPESVESVVLKPCPFCGGEARIETGLFDDGGRERRTWSIGCAGSDVGGHGDCRGTVDVGAGNFDKDDAIATWNTRALERVEPKESVGAMVPEGMTLVPVEDCPNCDNTGSYAVGGPEEFEQVQCEFCYTVPNSRFNIEAAIKDAAERVTK